MKPITEAEEHLIQLTIALKEERDKFQKAVELTKGNKHLASQFNARYWTQRLEAAYQLVAAQVDVVLAERAGDADKPDSEGRLLQ